MNKRKQGVVRADGIDDDLYSDRYNIVEIWFGVGAVVGDVYNVEILLEEPLDDNVSTILETVLPSAEFDKIIKHILLSYKIFS